MRRRGGAMAMAVAIGAGGMLLGCGASVPLPVPSPACGGFHLDVRNSGARPVEVRLNGLASLTVDGAAEAMIFEHGPGGVSPMPWRVEIVDVASGVVVATREVTDDGDDGAATIEIGADGGGRPVVGEVARAVGC